MTPSVPILAHPKPRPRHRHVGFEDADSNVHRMNIISYLHHGGIMAYLLRCRPFSKLSVKKSGCKIYHSVATFRVLPSRRSIMTNASSTHEERTAAIQREAGIHQVKITKIEQVNESVRLLRLSIPPSREVKACRGPLLPCIHLNCFANPQPPAV